MLPEVNGQFGVGSFEMSAPMTLDQTSRKNER
jgi:hypothetical protein